MEQIIYIIAGIGIAIVVYCLARFANSLLKKHIQREIVGQLKTFGEQRPEIFHRAKSDFTQNKSKIVANESENVQNDSDRVNSEAKNEPPLWNNKEKLLNLRSQIENGHFEEFQSEESLVNLPPLEALWKVDERIVQMEEMES